ncbi:MAG: hypothetical protein KC656_05730, partial [Myxococcales bacterium]|nr:hypothetical protein [Myxococcales bacterium]
AGLTRFEAHVPSPPGFIDDTDLITDPVAWNALVSRASMDRLPDWQANGQTFTGLDWLQFVAPGDTRVVAAGRGCGQAGCHTEEAGWMERSPMGTAVGIFSSPAFSAGLPSLTGDTAYSGTAGDRGQRDVLGAGGPPSTGRVAELVEAPEHTVFGVVGGTSVYQAPILAADLGSQVHDGTVSGLAAGQIVAGSDLDHLVTSALGQVCADCHLGNAGPNATTARYRA